MSKLTKIINFRLSNDDYDKYMTKVMMSGYNSSEFFRNAVLENKTEILHKEDVQRLLFQLNKIGNNINQLAYRANLDNFEGKITDDTYRSILSGLLPIRNKLFTMYELAVESKRTESEQ